MHEFPQGCEFRQTLQQDKRGVAFTEEGAGWESGPLSAASRARSMSSTFSGTGSDSCAGCCEPTFGLFFFGRCFRFFLGLVGSSGGGRASCVTGIAAAAEGLGVPWVDGGAVGVVLRPQTMLKQAMGSTNSAMRLIRPEMALFLARVVRRREFVIARAIGFHCFLPMWFRRV